MAMEAASENFRQYARAALRAKSLPDDALSLNLVARTLEETFGIPYHAVALDIDGTVTESGQREMSPHMLAALVNVINTGSYVLFVTGSGRVTAAGIMGQLQSQLASDRSAMRRIYAITGNGCYLLSFGPGGKVAHRSISPTLKQALGDQEYAELLRELETNFGADFEIDEKACGIRMVSREENPPLSVTTAVTSWFDSNGESVRKRGAKVALGRWGTRRTCDISLSDKDYALSWFYTEFDFIDVPILRVGDQGGETGNDFTFLDSQHGFSVGSLSSAITRCFPVFKSEERRVLSGLEGTLHLLRQVRWSSRLTVPSSLVLEETTTYQSVCDGLRRSAATLFATLENSWAPRAVDLVGKEDADRCVTAGFANVFDHKSGAVFLSDLEWGTKGDSPLRTFFREEDPELRKRGFPGLLRSMHTNTGIILRGPLYYLGLSHPPDVSQVITLSEENGTMLELIQSGVDSSASNRSLADWKFELGVLDLFRNNCLLLYSMLFQAASMSTSSQPYWKRLLREFEPYVTSGISLYYSLLTTDMNRFRTALTDLRRSVGGFFALRRAAGLLYSFLESNKIEPGKIVRKWREVDHGGQILSALLAEQGNIGAQLRKGKDVCALGLMYGGVELPFALRFLFAGSSAGHLSIAHMGGISFYRRERGSLVMEQYSRDVLESAIPNADRLEQVLKPGDLAIILDDNVMTGRTIELARDRLAAYGVQVPFSICVRFPGENRLHQMAMRRHGGIDPVALGRDIRGLVAQTPYSKILTSAKGYKDSTGVFDLSRTRIEHYLENNGNEVQD